MARFVLLVLVALHAPAAVAAERVCAPTSMVKLVTRLDAPGLAPNHVSRAARTLYRYGRRMGRSEEVHLLRVVAMPNVWTVDRTARTGTHAKDPGPTYVLHLPVFGDPGIRSERVKSLELGCELEWLEAAQATRTKVEHPTLGKVERLEYREGDEAVHLYVRSHRPLRIELHRGGQLVQGVSYLQYNTDLPFRGPLFEKPPGVDFSAAGGG